MKIQQYIPTLTAFTISLTAVIGSLILLQFYLHHFIIKSFLFFSFSSFIFGLNYVLIKYSITSSDKIKTVFSYIGLIIIIASSFIWFGIFSSGAMWHIPVGIGLLYLLAVTAQLLGWSASKPGILAKTIILLMIIVHLFLSFILIFKISLPNLYAIVFVACLVAIAGLLYGLYVFQPSREKAIKG